MFFLLFFVFLDLFFGFWLLLKKIQLSDYYDLKAHIPSFFDQIPARGTGEELIGVTVLGSKERGKVCERKKSSECSPHVLK